MKMKVSGLEPTSAEMNRMVSAAMEKITGLIEGLPESPVYVAPGEQGEPLKLIEQMPEQQSSLESALEFLFHEAAAVGLKPNSPGFMGYVPGGGLFHSALADLIANSINQYVAVGNVSPFLNQVEANVVRWLCEIVGYSSHARGFLTSGGSMATQSAITTARHALLGEQFLDGVIYLSDQVHHCVTKAAVLAGFPRANLRILPSDGASRLQPSIVEGAVNEDRKRHLRPFMIVASAGTVNTGAVDPLEELGELARKEGLWFHVDGAYGGLFRLTDRGKDILRGMETANSVVVDPHKTLFLPYGTGSLLVRDGSLLAEAHASSADYLPVLHDTHGDVWDFCELSPELTRPFRGLRVWLPMKLCGVGVFREYLDEKLDLARWAYEQISKIEAVEVMKPPTLSIFAFTVRNADGSIEDRNRRTRRLLNLINQKNRVHLTGTMLRGLFVIRVAIVAYRTHRDHVQMLIDDLVSSLVDV